MTGFSRSLLDVARAARRGVIATLAAMPLMGLAPAAFAETAPESVVTAAFLNPGKRGEVFWEMVSDTMLAAARQFNISLEIVYAERNYRLMQTQGLAMIARKDAPQFLILTNEDNAGVPVIAAADGGGVRTLLISSDVLAEDMRRLGGQRGVLKTWIGSLIPDVEAAGARMAERLFEAARQRNLQSSDGKLHFLVLSGDERTPTSLDRLRGLQRVVDAKADVVIDRVVIAHWNAGDAEELTARYLAWAARRGIRVAGVWAGNDPMAFGASDALRAAGFRPGVDTMVVGLNWSKRAVQEVNGGRMVLTDGGHFMLGAWSMIMLRDYLDGCDPFRSGGAVVLPTVAVTRANANRVLPVLERGDFARINAGMLRATTRGGQCRAYDFSLDAMLAAVGASAVE